MGAAWRELQSLCSVMCMCLMPSSIDTEPFFQSIWKFTSDKFWWGMLVISLLFVEAITIRDGKGLEGKTVGEPCQIDDQEVFPAVLFLEKQTPGSWNVSDNDGSKTLQDRRRLAPQKPLRLKFIYSTNDKEVDNDGLSFHLPLKMCYLFLAHVVRRTSLSVSSK